MSEVGLARRFASAVFGESNARKLAGLKSSVRATIGNVSSKDGRDNVAYLESFRDIHKGERCVIIGNGPSLNKTDLTLLRDEKTFGLNRIYLMFDKLGFSTTYHAVVNPHVVEQCAEDFQNLTAPLFTTYDNKSALGPKDGAGYLNSLVDRKFSRDLAHGVWEGATVTFVAMQIAYYMGFQEVILIGVDHSFSSKGPANKLVESDGSDPNHFDPNYFGKGFKWQLPDLEVSEIAYALARDAFAARGGRVVDATVDGKLDIFEKGRLEDLLA